MYLKYRSAPASMIVHWYCRWSAALEKYWVIHIVFNHHHDLEATVRSTDTSVVTIHRTVSDQQLCLTILSGSYSHWANAIITDREHRYSYSHNQSVIPAIVWYPADSVAIDSGDLLHNTSYTIRISCYGPEITHEYCEGHRRENVPYYNANITWSLGRPFENHKSLSNPEHCKK